MPTTEQLDSLRKIAKRATAGVWTSQPIKIAGEKMAGVGVFGTSVCIATTGPATDDQSMVDAEYIEAASPANMLALLAHIDALHAVADELISFQAEYAEKAFEPGGMPGNEYYRPKLVNIVNMARAARGQ